MKKIKDRCKKCGTVLFGSISTPIEEMKANSKKYTLMVRCPVCGTKNKVKSKY